MQLYQVLSGEDQAQTYLFYCDPVSTSIGSDCLTLFIATFYSFD